MPLPPTFTFPSLSLGLATATSAVILSTRPLPLLSFDSYFVHFWTWAPETLSDNSSTSDTSFFAVSVSPRINRQATTNMPARTLPTFTRAEVEAHNSKKSCYVTIGSNVYDVTDFAQDHPGGADLVYDYAGKDIDAILRDPTSHPHSEAAYEVLDDSLVGFVINQKAVGGLRKVNGAANGKTNGHANGNGKANGNANGTTEKTDEAEGVQMNEHGELWDGERWVHPRTGMASEEDLSKETDYTSDYKKHKFLDLSRPLFPQIWFGGFSKEFYLDQVHRPRHYKGGESAPLFGNFLEPLSKTPWWVVPLAWLPPVAYGTYLAREGMDSTFQEVCYWGFGFFLWSLIEYVLHRFLFHLDK